MLPRRRTTFLSSFLIFAVCLSLVTTKVAFADDITPTQPPPATETATEPPAATEPPVESTPTPTEATPTPDEAAMEIPVETTPTPTEAIPTPEGDVTPTETSEVPPPPEVTVDENTPVEVILSQVPEDTHVVVLDEQGQPVVLGSQDAADALVASDPVWCPASVVTPTAGANNCSISYANITDLLTAMRDNPTAFDEDGTIFLEKPSGQGFTTPLILDDSAGSLAGSFATLSTFNLTIQGGWNGNSPGTFSGNTNFGAAGGNEGYILIGSATNPWAGNITLQDITVSGISVANSVTVYTSTGNIVLSDVEVSQQAGTMYTAYLDSVSGDITVGNTSFFDGDNTGGDRNKGFYAETDTGSISITGTGYSPTFQDARGTNPANYNGATLSAPTVTLTNVISQDHDGNGIEILNANVVTLNNVTSGLNQNGEGNGLSGILINGTGSTIVTVNGGSFNRNGRYGIEILSASDITVVSNPSYNGNVLGNLYEDGAPDTSITSNPASPSNSSSASFSFTGTDNFTPPAGLTFQCSLDGSGFAVCTSPVSYAGLAEGSHNFQTRAVDQLGNSDPSPAGFAWIIDMTPPTIAPHSDETAEAASSAGAVVNYTSPATFDVVDGTGVASCSPVSGSLFALGDTTVTCTASDSAGHNAAPTSFVVHVVDTTGPVIDVHPDETTEATSSAGAVVNYPSPATFDAVDGVGMASCSPISGSLFALGDTTVTCTAVDTIGNVSVPTSFVVHVVDTTTPVIDAHGDETAEATSTGGAIVNYSSPATFDAVDGIGVASCSPVSGSLFALGDTTVTCTAGDSAGNVATPTSFVVHVIDTATPVIEAHGDETAEATSAGGAFVNYTSPATFDIADGAGVASCSPAPGSLFALGDTIVTCTAIDLSGNTATPTSFIVHVVDTTAPVIDAHSDETAEATSSAGAVVTYTNPATSDSVDGVGAASCLPASGSLFALGDTTVTCSASDFAGNAATPTSFVVHVVDTTAPVIDAHSDQTVEATSSAGAVVTYINPATFDAVDGVGMASCLPASGSLFALGNSTVTCTASDSAGNAATPISFAVHVVDTTAPVIDAHGDETAEATSTAGAIVTYTNPATSDVVDGAGVASCTPASGSPFALGDTTVTCTASDSAGNSATPISFAVHVVDTTPPVLNLPANIFTNATGPSGAIVSYSASANDLVDGSVLPNCAPASGSTFPVGPTVVNCTTTDAHNNSASGSFTINVQDPDAPILNLPANITAEATSPAGAMVSYSVSATDAIDGNVPVTCLSPSGSIFPLGTNTVNCSASDLSGNTNNGAFLITVEDTTAPTIASHPDITVGTSDQIGIIVNYSYPSASDLVDGSGTATCLPASGSFFPLGDTQVTCNAADNAGNSATPTTFVVHVIQPIVTPKPSSPIPTSSEFVIPITGGGLIDLDCYSTFWVGGIRVGFLNLCDYQSMLKGVDASSLPGTLPKGYSFVMGLDVDVLFNGKAIKDLPNGSGIRIDFPVYDASMDQFAVLYWSDEDGDGKGEWLEVTQELVEAETSQALLADPEDELYRIIKVSPPQTDRSYPIVTTEKTGIFILVRK